jgi:hypothetical protein
MELNLNDYCWRTTETFDDGRALSKRSVSSGSRVYWRRGAVSSTSPENVPG